MSRRDVVLIFVATLVTATIVMIVLSALGVLPNVVTMAFIATSIVTVLWLIISSARQEIIKHIDEAFAEHLAEHHDQEVPDQRTKEGEDNLGWLRKHDRRFTP